MPRQTRRCDIPPGLQARRTVLLGLGSLAAAALDAKPVRAATTGPSIADLVTDDGRPTILAGTLADTEVSLRGYLGPSLDGREFALTEALAMPCQLCGVIHDAGGSLAVRTAALVQGAPVLDSVLVTGRLALGGGVRLLDASIQG